MSLVTRRVSRSIMFGAIFLVTSVVVRLVVGRAFIYASRPPGVGREGFDARPLRPSGRLDRGRSRDGRVGHASEGDGIEGDEEDEGDTTDDNTDLSESDSDSASEGDGFEGDETESETESESEESEQLRVLLREERERENERKRAAAREPRVVMNRAANKVLGKRNIRDAKEAFRAGRDTLRAGVRRRLNGLLT